MKIVTRTRGFFHIFFPASFFEVLYAMGGGAFASPAKSCFLSFFVHNGFSLSKFNETLSQRSKLFSPKNS